MASFFDKVKNYLTAKFIRPRYVLDRRVKTIRLGTIYGGWTILESFLNDKSIVYCAGAGEDISFDIALAATYNCPVYIFDPTPKAIAYVKRQKENLEKNTASKLIMNEFGLFDKDTTLKFYAPNDADHVSHSISNLQHTDNFFEAKVMALSGIMSKLEHKHIDLLKIDIEGAEYEVVSDIIKNNYEIKTLCIEFHSPALKMVKAINSLQRSGYSVIDCSDYWNYTFYKI
jgi:FkbM family methyltransferase